MAPDVQPNGLSSYPEISAALPAVQIITVRVGVRKRLNELEPEANYLRQRSAQVLADGSLSAQHGRAGCRRQEGRRRYAGKPPVAHQHLALEPSHFARWLALFKRTVAEVCGEDSAFFVDRAHRIADSLDRPQHWVEGARDAGYEISAMTLSCGTGHAASP